MAEYIERTEELVLAMNAGARVIENTRRYHGTVYSKDVFSETPQKIPYLLAAKVLRGVEEAPAADVAPVVHGHRVGDGGFYARCSQCDGVLPLCANYCPNCGAKMDSERKDGGDG